MLRLEAVLGHRDDPRFAGRERDELPVTWAEAGRRRLRRATAAGLDAAIDLPPGSYLADGAVLADDGSRIVIVARTPEPALVIRISDALGANERLRCAALIGHAFGNQHTPVDIDGNAIRVPLTTSEEIARATVAALMLPGLAITAEEVALGCDAPLQAGHRHGPPDDHADHEHAHLPRRR